MTLPDLKSDCKNCAALCCVGLTLDKGDLFAIDKPSGTPCPNLGHNHRCGIHSDLETSGFKGCVLYDCAGAGQRVTQERFNGESWRDAPELLYAMMRDFANLRPLHERMAQLVAAGDMELPEDLEIRRLALLKRLARSWADTEAMTAAYDAFLNDLPYKDTE